ncbi:MAG: hypothetical protein U0235_12220 [Polyangiaceae bacterium]
MRAPSLRTYSALSLVLLTVACGAEPPPEPSVAPPTTASPPVARPSVAPATAPAAAPALTRDAFNRAAFALGQPLFWERDANGNGEPDEAEVKSTLFAMPGATDSPLAARIDRVKAYARKPADDASKGGREARIRAENEQIRPVLVRSDLRALPAAERAMVKHLFEATLAVDRLHARQRGLLALMPQVAKADDESRALFYRNWGPRCAAPTTENDPTCTALPGVERVRVDVYPDKMQDDPKFCAALEKRPDAKKLLEPFTVVRDVGGKLTAVPYAAATTTMPDGSVTKYADDANAAASALEAAAKDLEGTTEKALAQYMKAAATAFRTNRWFDADDAWAKMGGAHSKYYLRIAPDETYWEPCAEKAGFHVSFARVSEASLAWQAKLEPVKQSMEEALAQTVPSDYRARKVTFHLPEFIDVVWNGGDSRDSIGATVGQSLPNWGPIPAKGRGRTVAMANLYTDEDSLASRKRAAESLLCASAMPYYPEGKEPGLVATILHEATHNLGPSQEYRFKGKTDAEWFGGGLASTMEELKAQTGALFFLDLLKSRGVVDEKLERTAALDSIIWAFGHISRGMTTPTGERKPYSQLAAIQVGFLMDEGAVTFADGERAANGRDAGCFAVDWTKFTPAAHKLMATVAKLKATGDKKGAEALAGRHVDAARKHDVIRERMLCEPRPSFLYALDLDP